MTDAATDLTDLVVEPDAPVGAAGRWPTNAEFIADAARLYLDPDMAIADATYGKGIWWRAWRPRQLVAHDLTVDGVDFRALPEPDDTFDAELQVIYDGLAEVARVLKPGGIVLCKCQDYISSGKSWNGTWHTQSAAFEIGFTQIDRFEHVESVRAARRNLSTLFVFQAPR